MANEYHTIDFPLQKNLSPVSIDFIPHGTRTLKIKVTNPERISGKLVMRTRNVPKGFGKKRFYSHEQQGANFRVSWGGGQEKGVCLQGEDVKLAGKKIPIRLCQEFEGQSFIYLNVTHLEGPVDRTYTLELSVVDEKSRANAAPKFSRKVNLTPPAQIQDGQVTHPVRLVQGVDGYRFEGSRVLSYVARWWSPAEITFPTLNIPLPDFRLEADGNLLKIKMGPDFETIAHVQDNILFQGVIDRSRFFDAELYHFTEHFFVLRLWFSWLEKHGVDTALDEIPDAERFDLVVDARKKRVVYAATDFHWRETWVPVPRPLPRRYLVAHLGFFSNSGFSFLSGKLPLAESRYDGWLAWIEEAIQKEELQEAASGDPSVARIPSDTVRLAVEEKLRAGDLGANVEAHVPHFENVDRPEGINFISSDPTKI